MKTKTLPRSLGSVLLARTGQTQEEIAARINVSRSLVGHWLTGHRVPTGDNRLALRAAYGIPVEAWDTPATEAAAASVTAEQAAAASSAPPAPAPGAPPPWGESATRARARRLGEMVDGMIEEAMKGAPAERALVARRAAATLELLAKVTGESQVISEARIVRLPAWRRIEEALVRALTPWPDALRAVGEELSRIGAGE